MPKDILKVVLIGDGGVGKTSLRNQFIQKRFTSAYKATIGADFITKEVIRDDGRPVMLQIWDTAGQERFQSLGVAFYRGADACVLVYDVNNYPTFQHLERWHTEFLAQAGIASSHANDFPFLIIGNKIDVNDRVVSRRQARALAQQLSRRAAEFAGAAMGVEIMCFEASAKEGTGVEEAFSHIARIAKTPQMELDLTGVDRTRLRRSDSTGGFSVRSRLERRKAEAGGSNACCW